MKNTLITLALVIGILFTTAWAQQPRTQLEYKFDSKCSEKRANEMASEGWELFSMSMGTWRDISTPTCVFKRAK